MVIKSLDGDLLARLGVATRTLLLVAQLEVAEPRELDAFTADQRGADLLEEGLDHVLELACIRLNNQGETCLVWDKNSGQPIYHAIVWQDRRTARFADKISERAGDAIREKTGLTIDAYFSATKIKWILDNVGSKYPSWRY